MSRFRVGSAELSFTKSVHLKSLALESLATKVLTKNILAGCAVLALMSTAPAIAADTPPLPAASAEEKPVASPNAAPKVTLPYKLITTPTPLDAAPAKPVQAQPAQAKPTEIEPAVAPSAPKQAVPQETASKPDANTAPKSEAPTASVVAAPAVAIKPEPPKITLNIDIDLTKQRMTLTEYGNVVGSWAISSGAEGHRSPTGTFRPVWSSKMWFSKQYDNAPMPHAVFFNGGVAMHATQSVGRLGSPASHGCIRQSPANAEKTYKLVAKHGNTHTKIVVHGKPKDDEPRMARRDRGNNRDMASTGYASRERYERPAMRRVILVDGYGNRRIAEIPANDPRLAAYQNRSYGGGYGGGYGRAW